MGHGNRKEKKRKKLFKGHDLKPESMDITVEDIDIDFLDNEIDFMEIAAIVADSCIKGKELVENQGKMIEEIVPMRFHKYLKVFSEEECKRLPERKSWDHEIELREDFVLKKAKIIPLSMDEQKVLDKFIEENLEKGYICVSKSPQTMAIFFMYNPKMQLVQDYCYLNSWTIKNNYPLPLISDCIEKLGKAKCFTKLDIRQGYNNVRI